MKKLQLSKARNTALYFLLVVSVFFVSCEGPVGPAGAAGAAGAAGSVGPAGPAGAAGAANVQIWNRLISASDFLRTGNGPWLAGYDVPAITQNVISDGAVIAFYVVSDQGVDGLFSPSTVGLGVAFSVGEFVAIITNSAVAPASFVGGSFRLVIIPPASMAVLKDVDQSDPNAVLEAIR